LRLREVANLESRISILDEHLDEGDRFQLFFAFLLGSAALTVGHFISVEDVELLLQQFLRDGKAVHSEHFDVWLRHVELRLGQLGGGQRPLILEHARSATRVDHSVVPLCVSQFGEFVRRSAIISCTEIATQRITAFFGNPAIRSQLACLSYRDHVSLGA
jgi:hypothetical protein